MDFNFSLLFVILLFHVLIIPLLFVGNIYCIFCITDSFILLFISALFISVTFFLKIVVNASIIPRLLNGSTNVLLISSLPGKSTIKNDTNFFSLLSSSIPKIKSYTNTERDDSILFGVSLIRLWRLRSSSTLLVKLENLPKVSVIFLLGINLYFTSFVSIV